MARSWDELSTDHKIVFLLESLVQKQDQRTPIACRLCDEIFFDNKSLVNHFQSHFHPDGTFNPSSLVQNFASPESEIKLFSSSSQFTHYFSMPVNACNHIANENLVSSASQSVSSNPPKLSLGKSLVSTPSQNPVQLRVQPTLTHKHQSIQSPSSFRSAMNHGSSASGPTGPQNVHSPIEPKTSGIFTSKIKEGSNFRFPMKPGTSTSQPIQQSSFSPPVTVGKPSHSIPSTSGRILGKRPQTAMKIEVEDPLARYTKPYITQLEQPIEEMAAGHVDVGGNNSADELDLTLKL